MLLHKAEILSAEYATCAPRGSGNAFRVYARHT